MVKLPACTNCDDTGWVCEFHPDQPWRGVSKRKDACECGAGMPCDVCDDWRFYQAELVMFGGHITVAAEPHKAGSATVTLDVLAKRHDGSTQNATMFMTADEALELWTALGHGIANASGNLPQPVKLIKTE